MPRQNKDPERVRRAARMYLAGEIDMRAACERAGGISRSAIWLAISQLREEAGNAAITAGG